MRLAFILIALLVAVAAYAGSSSLTSVSAGRIQTTHVNQYFSALNQDVVPRNSSGVATTRGGSLGTSVLMWLKAWIESGYWKAGDIKLHHTYNGTVGCGQGWMLADGRVIGSAVYDTEQGAGSWTTYVGTSPLNGKYLPNFTGRYPVGKATTTQTGASAITAVGNTSNTVNIAHTHTAGPARWYDGQIAANSQYFNGNGSGVDIYGNVTISASAFGIWAGFCNAPSAATGNANNGCMGPDAFTEMVTSGSSLSATQTIQPDSIEVQYCMRIID